MRIKHVYFPTSGFVSLVQTLREGSSIEVGMVGREGLFGHELIRPGDISMVTAAVQGQGQALCMGLPLFRQHWDRSTAMRSMVQQHSSYRRRQTAQTILCTRFHAVEQRLARLLILTVDRAGNTSFSVSHELLSYLLGARRAGVTVAMGMLRERGLISYQPRKVTILDLPRADRCGLLSHGGGPAGKPQRVGAMNY
ncbi:MAG: Crp/Fnr family transcriptional regulator [Dokdonella sp.]